MTREISVTLSQNGTAVTDATVTLSDSTATYGVRETVSDTVVVAAGTDVPHVGAGVYTYDFTGAEDGIAYESVVKVVWANGDIDYYDRPLTAGSETATGYYADQTDMETRIGSESVAAFSNVSGDTTTANTTRIEHVLLDADRQIDEVLRANGYVTPVATTSDDFDTLTDIACDLAYCKLMDIRMPRLDAPDAMGRELFFKRKNAMDRLRFLARRGIDATRLADTINDADGRQPQAV